MSKYEIINYSDKDNESYLIFNTEINRYFAGYDFMYSINWTKDLSKAFVSTTKDEVSQIVEDLKASDDDSEEMTISELVETWIVNEDTEPTIITEEEAAGYLECTEMAFGHKMNYSAAEFASAWNAIINR